MEDRDPLDLLSTALTRSGEGFVELRYHGRTTRSVSVEKGRVDQARTSEVAGVGVRVLADGTWGFASTDELELDAVVRSIESARGAAPASAAARKELIPDLPQVELARGSFEEPGWEEAIQRPVDEALQMVLRIEAATRAQASAVTSASCGYTEIFEDKALVTSDGARARVRLVRPEFRVSAVASGAGELQRGSRSVGATGGWECLFQSAQADELSEQAARLAVDLLSADYPGGGRKRVLLSPALVGLLTHEAVGHTVEADFVEAGSCARGKLGQSVASEHVTLCDSGASEYYAGAGGSLPVDDEGVPTQRTVVIQDGVLQSYLHNRESAARAGVAPTGNARAWEYQSEPLIRMRNPYIEPGEKSLAELVAETQDGYLLDGAANGQADANGEFMFGTHEAYAIKDGKRGPLLRGVNISGRAFEVLSTVSAVSSDFRWDLGAGFCGKGQPAKVAAGGPWLACEVLLGGRQ